jgi:hypothetical protein
MKYGTLILLGLLTVAAGCATTPPSRLYLLNSQPPPQTVHTGQTTAVGVDLHVEIADYLDRPQILVREDEHRLSLAELDRWAEPLSRMLTRVLRRELSANLASAGQGVDFQPAGDVDYRLAISIQRMDGIPGHQVILEAQWSIHSAERDAKAVRFFVCNEEVRGPGIQGLVDAHNRAVRALGGAISESLGEKIRSR